MKITEIKVTKFRTEHIKDAYGNRVGHQIEYEANRKIKVMSGGKRFAHFFIDFIGFQIIWYCIGFVFGLIMEGDLLPKVVLSIGFFSNGLTSILSYPLYYILFEHFWQKTPGKFITECTVVNLYGDKPDFKTNILRNIIRIVPFEIFSCFVFLNLAIK